MRSAPLLVLALLVLGAAPPAPPRAQAQEKASDASAPPAAAPPSPAGQAPPPAPSEQKASDASTPPAAAAAPAAPSTGKAADQPAPPVAQRPAPAKGKTNSRPATSFLEGFGRTPQEEKLLQEISRAIENYESDAKDFRRDIQFLIEKRYDEKKESLSRSYERAIRDLEVVERKERLDAIAQFEEFLRRHPDSAKHTPDVMFRLAELYYERSSDEHVVAMREYEEKLSRTDTSKTENIPPEPQVDYSKSLAIYQQLIEKFPNYRLNDAVYYLLGYCREKQNEFEKGREAYQILIANYPQSRFATEAWVRIGEYYFDAYNQPDALGKAAAAYEAAVRDTSHPLYDKALYKLGWTYYRMDRFDEAVSRFIALADYYDANGKTRGEAQAGGELRDEALQYIAISLVDEKWGSLAKAKELFQKVGSRPYEGEIYRRMGNIYFDQTKHPEAIEAYRLVLAKEPLAKDAPQLQERIVQAYERDRKLADAFRESQLLAKSYQPGTPWYEKYRSDPDVIAASQELMERSLYSGAIFHHQQALVYKREGKFDAAKSAFEVAAKAYAAYLERFPRTKSAYEMQFYYGECLYNSLQFAQAAKQYVAVRDSTQDNRFLTESTFAAVLAWQKEVELEVRENKLPQLKPLRSTERPEGQPVKLIPLADAEKEMVAASDAYLAKFKKEPKAPEVAYKAAELYYSHNDFPEARRRFEEIIKSYPSSEVAQYATNLTVESFLIDKDWKSVEEVSARLAANKTVIDPKSSLYKDLVKFKLAGRFKLADEMIEKGDFENAAQKYIALVDEEPRHEFADKALNNAAVAYEKSRRFDSALKLYERIYREYPNSKLADSALFRVAVNAENSYDFDKAVDNYQKLIKDYPASKNREAALFNSARLLEGEQRYREAAAAFLRYADLFPNSEDTPKNIFRAALIYEKQSDWKGEIRALDEFVKKYDRKSAQVELVIDARKRIGDAHRKLGNESDARRAYESAAREFDRRRLQPDANPVAADAAAQARFQLAEHEFNQFDKLKIGGRGKALERSFAAKRAAVKRVNDAYGEVFPYKRLEWTLAALYRRGYALERFGATIIETPIPPEVKRLGEEAVVAYQDLLAQQTASLEDKAVESYAATLAEARKNHIANQWTKKTLEALNRFRPKEYPVLKEPKQSIAADSTYPSGLVGKMAQAESAAPSRTGGKVK